MVWWVAVPVVAWAGKKIYDMVTEDNSSSYSSSSSSLSNEKSKRTKARKEAVSSKIDEHRMKILQKLEKIGNSSEIGKIVINKENYSVISIDFCEYREIRELLTNSKYILGGEKIVSEEGDIGVHVLNVPDKAILVNMVVKKANSEYGELAGIDSHNDYVKSEDPFFEVLKHV